MGREKEEEGVFCKKIPALEHLTKKYTCSAEPSLWHGAREYPLWDFAET